MLGLTTETTYYFIAFGVDRSGNQTQSGEYQSGEYQIEAQTKTYLPLVLRR